MGGGEAGAPQRVLGAVTGGTVAVVQPDDPGRAQVPQQAFAQQSCGAVGRRAGGDVGLGVGPVHLGHTRGGGTERFSLMWGGRGWEGTGETGLFNDCSIFSFIRRFLVERIVWNSGISF